MTKAEQSMKASDFIQKWSDGHGGNGKDWKDLVSRVASDDIFNFNVIPYAYRPFDTKFIIYTGRIGIIGAPRWVLSKHFLLEKNSTWRYGTERLLWVYEDKPNDMLENELRIALANMEQCPFDKLWLCDFNMFRVAFGMMSVANRTIIAPDLFCESKARKIEDYDPYERPTGFTISGEEWVNVLDFIGSIEDKQHNNL